MNTLEQFKHQQYLNFETFRRTGEGLKTPVWFTQEGDILFVRTVDGSGKVKRVHNNARVNIAPCKVDGALLGEWMPAHALHVKDPGIDKKVADMIRKKYGLMAFVLAISSILRRNAYAILEIKLDK
jgi:PPOX class probable F420-dependent enzyme